MSSSFILSWVLSFLTKPFITWPKSSECFSLRGIITAHKRVGGIRIRDIQVTKHSIYIRRVIRVFNREDSLWAKVLITNYSPLTFGTYITSLVLPMSGRDLAHPLIVWGMILGSSLVNGSTTKVWEDLWIENIPISKWSTHLLTLVLCNILIRLQSLFGNGMNFQCAFFRF